VTVDDKVAEGSPHPSNSADQLAAEAAILAALELALGVTFEQGTRIALGDSHVCPDGVTADRSVFVEVFARIGTLRGGQRHKVSTDALKLLAIRDVFPGARLILAFADVQAAASISGWKADALRSNDIEIYTVDLTAAERATLKAAQDRQRR